MADVLVQELDSAVIQQLTERACRNGRPLQAEVKVILEQAAQSDGEECTIEKTEIIRPDADVHLTVAEMASGLQTLGKPTVQESLDLGVDPDDYPLF